jgi:hypothetical protein
MSFVIRNAYLLTMAALEAAQCVSDVAGGNFPRAIIMACAATSSIALIWVVY